MEDKEDEIVRLKTWINELLEKDRQRIAWREQVQRNLPKYTFEKIKKRIEGGN